MTPSLATRLGLLTASCVFIIDQLSKYWVLEILHLPTLRRIELLPVLSLTMVWNQGVTFGLLSGFGDQLYLALAAGSLLVVVFLMIWLRRAQARLVAVAIGGIIGGAIGNVLDRVRFGAVVDFIHAHVDTAWGELSWYVFNVADAAIVCGVGVLIIDSLWPLGGKPTPEPPAGTPKPPGNDRNI
jgi:lipoprotein signal peptidase